MEKKSIFILMSLCVRFTPDCTAEVFPFNSFDAKPTALRITPHERTIPIIPAIAIPPIPIYRA